MSIKSKLGILVAAFLSVIAAFAVGSFFIFSHMRGNFEFIKLTEHEHMLQENFRSAAANYLKTVKGWALTGDRHFKRKYHERLSDVYRNFGELDKISKDKAGIAEIGKEFQGLKGFADIIMSAEEPVGEKRVVFASRGLEMREQEFLSKIDALTDKSLKDVSVAVERGEGIKNEIAYYFTFLVILSCLAFMLLALFMRRMIAVPFNDMLIATDRVASGNLDYRIASKRKDEFGVIALRFDKMTEELKKTSERNAELYISAKNQLQELGAMYELGSAVASTVDLDALLMRIAEKATLLLNARGCIIRLLEDGKLVIKASYGLPKETEKEMTLSAGEGLPGKVAELGRPILVEDFSKMPASWQIPHLNAKSALNVPLVVGDKVIGTWALYDKKGAGGEITSFSEEDLRTAEGFASLSAIAIEKAKIYGLQLKSEREALEAKKRMDILFDSVEGGILTVDRAFNILSANRFVETWVGKPLPEIVGRNCLDVFHGKKGICPHCVAQVTCETGDINAVTQMSGLNYAELTSYPIKDDKGNVEECVVFIQDITDRVLYQEEMLSLYRESTQTKEYLESLIDNSADAIVTSDLKGIVTSWNKGAEKIYGFAESDALGKYLPFIPESLLEHEREYTERVRNGEVLKDLETGRVRKDGLLIEVSLTLSPIKDASGAIIGISGISRDISGRKTVEKELIKRNQELSKLFFISSAMRSTLDLDRLLRMILTAVTMGDGLGFNRAVLFLTDEDKNVLRGAMGVGPSSYEEAGRVWRRLSVEGRTLEKAIEEIVDIEPKKADDFLDRLSLGIEIPLTGDSLFVRSVSNKEHFNVKNARQEPLTDAILIQQFGTEAYAIVPLVSRDRVIGVLFVDNLFNKKPITDEDMRFLTAFSNQMAAAIESAKLFEKVSIAEAELENIFRSITDMVYFTDMNYTIKSINKAVSNRFGLSEKEILGRKCYEVFHGMKEPWTSCPHHKTVTMKKSFIEEIDDPYSGGSFLASTSPLFDSAGNFLGTAHIVRDITELKTMRDKLVSSQRMAALGEVAARVAHEIRNPLVSIGGFAQRLEGKLEGNLKEYAAIVSREVKRLEDILRDILGFVREVRLSTSRVNVNTLLGDIFSLVGSEMSDRGISLKTDFADIPDVIVDMDRIKDAFLNIVNNAIQAIGNHGSIVARTYVRNEEVVVEIGDSGSGIEEKDLPFIFDPFYTTKAAGTGLGLAITRRIIEEHKGRIEVKSKLGEGTTMRVFLAIGKEEKK